jgi:hypothetical protein
MLSLNKHKLKTKYVSFLVVRQIMYLPDRSS